MNTKGKNRQQQPSQTIVSLQILRTMELMEGRKKKGNTDRVCKKSDRKG